MKLNISSPSSLRVIESLCLNVIDNFRGRSKIANLRGYETEDVKFPTYNYGPEIAHGLPPKYECVVAQEKHPGSNVFVTSNSLVKGQSWKCLEYKIKQSSLSFYIFLVICDDLLCHLVWKYRGPLVRLGLLWFHLSLLSISCLSN